MTELEKIKYSKEIINLNQLGYNYLDVSRRYLLTSRKGRIAELENRLNLIKASEVLEDDIKKNTIKEYEILIEGFIQSIKPLEDEIILYKYLNDSIKLELDVKVPSNSAKVISKNEPIIRSKKNDETTSDSILGCSMFLIFPLFLALSGYFHLPVILFVLGGVAMVLGIWWNKK